MTKSDIYSRDWSAVTPSEALSLLIEADVALWGEDQRDAAARLRAGTSPGRALNALAHHELAAFGADAPADLKRAAKRALTSRDWRALRAAL